jgi:hypothetical protein
MEGTIMNARFRAAGIFAVATLMIGFLFSGVALAIAPIEVSLTGAEEVPPVKSDAKGTSNIVIGDDKSVSGTVKTSKVKGTMAHIHQGAKGENGPPIITLTMSSPGEWTVPPGTMLTNEQYQSLKDGNLYINVHSDAHKGGEIRAQLKLKP